MSEQLEGGWRSVIILGLIEGITEFLPISSTGHLIVAAHLLGETSNAATVFEVVIQLGAIAAIGWHYRQRLLHMAGGILTLRRQPHSPAAKLALQLFIAFLPAAFLGFFLHGLIKAYLFTPHTVALALIGGGVILLLVERKPRPPRLHTLEQLTTKDALLIGCAQSLALFPGVSRAGATIVGGLLRGLERKCAAEFSFLLALPTMCAAAAYDLYQNAALLSSALLAQIAGGFVVAFIAALLTVRALLYFVSRHTFTPFGWYRIAFGVMILLAPPLFGGAQ